VQNRKKSNNWFRIYDRESDVGNFGHHFVFGRLVLEIDINNFGDYIDDKNYEIDARSRSARDLAHREIHVHLAVGDISRAKRDLTLQLSLVDARFSRRWREP